MWELENSWQVVSFFTCFLFGAGYCVLYDILRAVRKKRRFSDLKVAFQDLCYFLFIALVTFLLFLKYTYGEIRLYIFVAIFMGFFGFRLALSRYFMKIAVRMAGFVFRCLDAVLSLFDRIKNKISRILQKYIGIFIKYCKKYLKNLKNHLKHKP
ncbi:MAG: spore cortex biosynthesis protein YabQ [Clostridiales bacterium]|nr:spore cortex biosynthesis protein YabQ [Candidatus Equinaster intestinalis]